jgi:hypothetical protein
MSTAVTTHELPPPVPTSVDSTRTGLSTAALVLGIVGAVVGLIPLLGIIAIPCGILAIIFGIVGIRRRARKGFAIAGLATGVVALTFGILGLVIVNNAFDDLKVCTDAVSTDLRTGTQTADAVCGN